MTDETSKISRVLQQWYQCDYRSIAASNWEIKVVDGFKHFMNRSQLDGDGLYTWKTTIKGKAAFIIVTYHFPSLLGMETVKLSSVQLDCIRSSVTESFGKDVEEQFLEKFVDKALIDFFRPLYESRTRNDERSLFEKVESTLSAMEKIDVLQQLMDIQSSNEKEIQQQRNKQIAKKEEPFTKNQADSVQFTNKNPENYPAEFPSLRGSDQEVLSQPAKNNQNAAAKKQYKEIKYDLEAQPVDPREKEKQEKLEKHFATRKEFEQAYKFFISKDHPERRSKVKEIPGDLFQSTDSLAHCVSEDFSMSAGIATQFGKRFPPMQDVCFNMYVYRGGVAPFEDRKGRRFIYNLVTKVKFNDKPLYQDFRSSLQKMRDHAVEKGLKAISMPQIGCGLDLLEWEYVRDIIEETFHDTDIQITVYVLEAAPSTSRGGGYTGKSAHGNRRGGDQRPHGNGRDTESNFRPNKMNRQDHGNSRQDHGNKNQKRL